MAKHAEVSRPTIARVETGATSPQALWRRLLRRSANTFVSPTNPEEQRTL
ncbi:hypothetical protein [Rothia sp. P7208]